MRTLGNRLLASASSAFSFAHLAGLGGKAAKGENDLREEDQEEGAETEDTEEEAETSETDEPENGGKKGKKGKKGANGDGEKDEAEASTGENDGDEDEEEDDDEDEAEVSGGKKASKTSAAHAQRRVAKTDKASFKKGRKAERARVGRILSSPAAANNIALACKLAANTGMSSAAAIAMLEEAPAVRGGRLDRRMSDAAVPGVKAGGGQPSGSDGIQASWDTAFKKLLSAPINVSSNPS